MALGKEVLLMNAVHYFLKPCIILLKGKVLTVLIKNILQILIIIWFSYRFVLTKDIVRFGKWFVQPCTSNERIFGRRLV